MHICTVRKAVIQLEAAVNQIEVMPYPEQSQKFDMREELSSGELYWIQDLLEEVLAVTGKSPSMWIEGIFSSDHQLAGLELRYSRSSKTNGRARR